MPANEAAWLDAPYATLAVRPAPYTAPGADEITIRTRAVALNPLDSVKQATGNLMYRWLPYPSVLGEDVAGEVVEVGPGVTRFAVGDRVLGYAVGMEKQRQHQAEGGFQLYTVLRVGLTAPIPDGLSFEDAAVLPLGLSTAASALFQRDQLGLRHPVAQDAEAGASSTPAPPSAPTEVVVVWGASTSVGSNAVQLARAAGYDVVATASPRNHDRARRLGATRVFDYRSPTVVQDIVAATAGRPIAGVLAIGTGSAGPAVAVAIAGGAKRVTLASPPVSVEGLPQRAVSPDHVRLGLRLVASNVAVQARARPRGILVRFVWGSTLMGNEVGPMIWQRFLPDALAAGRFQAEPPAEVVGHGLAALQPALERLRAGVSATKLVVTL